MTTDGYITVMEVSFLIGSSVQTITSWYKWKEQNPQHKLAELLPDYVRKGKKNTRYWRQSDVWKLVDFKNSIPQGRAGIMGSVTQKYVKKEKKDVRKT